MKRLLLSVFALVVAGSVFAQPAAQSVIAPPPNQYTVKIICGKGDGSAAARGIYFTVVNIHNPNPTPLGYVGGRKKFVVTVPDEATTGPSAYTNFRVPSDGAMRIDCPNVWKHLAMPAGTFVDGFAVIESAQEVDVVAVYTAEGSQGVSSIHIERVPVKKQLF